jgi:hypothetical protein
MGWISYYQIDARDGLKPVLVFPPLSHALSRTVQNGAWRIRCDELKVR